MVEEVIGALVNLIIALILLDIFFLGIILPIDPPLIFRLSEILLGTSVFVTPGPVSVSIRSNIRS